MHLLGHAARCVQRRGAVLPFRAVRDHARGRMRCHGAVCPRGAPHFSAGASQGPSPTRPPLPHMGCSDVAMALEKGRSPLRLPAESSGPNVDSSDRRSRFHECATAEALLSLEPRAAFGPSGLCTCSFRTRSCSAAITPTLCTCLTLLPAPSSAGLSGIAPLVGLFWGVNPALSRKDSMRGVVGVSPGPYCGPGLWRGGSCV